MADDLDDVTDDEAAESSGAQIAVHWREEETYPPPASFTAQANASDPAIREQFTEDKFPDSFTAYADLLTWFKPWDTVLDTSNAPFWKWFVGGELNASYNCVDRHLASHPNKAALIWVPEPEGETHQAITYRELYVRVNEFAAVLKDLGLKAGDRITFHMPMVSPSCRSRCLPRPGSASSSTRRSSPSARHGGRAPDRRLRLHRARHDGRLLPQRRPGQTRPQGQGRRGPSKPPPRNASRSTRFSSTCPHVTWASTPPPPRWSRGGTSSSTTSSPRTRARSSSRCHCRRRTRCS